jgi:NADH dehydrogenase
MASNFTVIINFRFYSIKMNIPRTSNPRIVIIGGGFAGISLAKKLSKQEVQVVLLDKHNYHTFQPLLYQVFNRRT